MTFSENFVSSESTFSRERRVSGMVSSDRWVYPVMSHTRIVIQLPMFIKEELFVGIPRHYPCFYFSVNDTVNKKRESYRSVRFSKTGRTSNQSVWTWRQVRFSIFFFFFLQSTNSNNDDEGSRDIQLVRWTFEYSK